MLGPFQCGIRHIVYKAYFDATCQKSLKVVVPISKAAFCSLQRAVFVAISFDDKQHAAFLNDRSVLLAQRASPHKLCGTDPPEITRRSPERPMRHGTLSASRVPAYGLSQSPTRTIVRIQTIDFGCNCTP
jgi:hypothetical protein